MTENQDCLYFDEKACEEIEKTMKSIGYKPLTVGKATNIGNIEIKMVETSTLPEEPEIYADNEEDREILRSCFYD